MSYNKKNKQKTIIPKLVTLVYNGQREVIVDRKLASDSCFFLNRLLEGPFKEAKKSRIDIHLSKHYSFDCFKKILQFATENVFIRTDNFDLLFQMIQLAKLWFYDELIDIIEDHLINNVNKRTIMKFYFLSLHINLENLERKCIMYEQFIEENIGNVGRNWPRCAVPGHHNHLYSYCLTDSENEDLKPDWNEVNENSIIKSTYKTEKVGLKPSNSLSCSKIASLPIAQRIAIQGTYISTINRLF